VSTDAQVKGFGRSNGGGLERRSRTVSTLHPKLSDVPANAEISPVWEAAGGTRGQTEPVATVARDTIVRRAIAVSDVAAAYLALLLVVSTVPSTGVLALRWTGLLIAPGIVLAAKAIGLYDRDQHVLRKTTIDEVPSIFQLSLLYALSAWLAEVLLFHGALSRAQVFALTVVSFTFIALGRLLSRSVTAALLEPERCIVVGDARDCQRIENKLQGAPGVNATIVGRVALHAEDNGDRHLSRVSRSLTKPGELAQIIATERVERVIIAPDSHDQDEVLHVIRLIKALGVRVSVLPRLLEVVGSSSTFEDVDGMTLLGVRQYGVSKSSAMLKRAMDVAGAAVGLIVLAPLLALLAVAIKLDSSGPVFFRQRRIGRHGETFSMLKYRSMVENAEDIKSTLHDRNEARGGLFKITNDPRITRVGGFLRRTSLDELPQLLNVLAGSMSLVGPRPLILDEDALIEGWQRRRLSVKPGMTGMWQIFGSSRIPMDEMVKIDYLYGANWSLWLDLKILLRTVPYVLRRRGI
jgi:exopolysaccharide biosynthesis polyprenyl glycosylphosphotransferase